MGYLDNLIVLSQPYHETVYYFDELIVSEIKKGNSTALRELYKTHFSMILNLICTNSGTEQEAKDIYQEAVINLYEKLQQPDFQLTCKIKTYLYAVSRRLWLKRLAEKKRYFGNIEETETFIGVEEEVAEAEVKEKMFEQMASSLDALGEPCRALLEAFYFKNVSMDELTQQFSYTNTDTAKTQKYKCLQRLKKLFFSNN